MILDKITFCASITATSNKTKEHFTPRKTAFLKVDDKDKERLISFGVREYTSPYGESFFCVKLPNSIKLSSPGRNKTFDTSVNAPNFRTMKDVFFLMTVIKGNKNNTDFFRLTDIRCEEVDIETAK